MKIIIAGAGIAGLSLAWALSRRGHSVTIYDQGPIPNPISSSYDEHRLTRHAYGVHGHYAKLMPDAFRMWERLWDEIGVRHYAPIGATYFIREATPWYEASMASLDELRIAYRDVPPNEVSLRFPMINPDGLTRTVETAGAGMLFASRILNDLVVLLTRAGVELQAYCPVTEIDTERARAKVGGEWVGADAVAVAAGAWADRLVPALRKDAVPSRQTVLYLAPPPRYAEAWAAAPILVDTGLLSGTYALPPRHGMRLKIGDHVFTRKGDADESRVATAADLSRLRSAIAIAYRDSDSYSEIERKACYYTVHQQERFIVRAIGRCGYVVSACSGHGFKLQPLITERVAQAITGERDIADVEAWAAGFG